MVLLSHLGQAKRPRLSQLSAVQPAYGNRYTFHRQGSSTHNHDHHTGRIHTITVAIIITIVILLQTEVRHQVVIGRVSRQTKHAGGLSGCQYPQIHPPTSISTHFKGGEGVQPRLQQNFGLWSGSFYPAPPLVYIL